MCVEPRCSYFYSWRNSHNSKFMYLSKPSRVYKVIFVLLVVIVACAVELLFGLHQDLHYTVFLWILSSFFPTKISWSSVYVLWDAVWGGAPDSSNLRVFLIYTSAFFYRVVIHKNETITMERLLGLFVGEKKVFSLRRE